MPCPSYLRPRKVGNTLCPTALVAPTARLEGTMLA